MAKTFYLEILTPTRVFYTGEAESLMMPIQDGMYGVAVGHEPVVTALEAGVLKYKVDGVWQTAAVSGGFAEVMPEHSILLVASAEHPEEIDFKRAEAAKARAEERIRQKRSVQEYYRSQAALSRAMARLKTRQD